MIRAHVITHSRCAVSNISIVTLQYSAPRSILAEINTHRAFSRNARSSRAVPVPKILEEVVNNPFIPLVWGKNQPGMQADVLMTPEEQARAVMVWLQARDDAVKRAAKLMEFGAHKQIINRLLEPWMWVHGVITSTEFSNFYHLRRHPAAEPHFKILADHIHQAIVNSRPEYIRPGSQNMWHLPYVTQDEMMGYSVDDLQMISAARCARVSYAPHDGSRIDPDRDIEVARTKLLKGRPIHASPFEHQARPDYRYEVSGHWREPDFHGNFVGWVQLRKLLEHQFMPDPSANLS